jgi:DNA-binding sugar fermentation-stimulating protein
MDPKFEEALIAAKIAGVEILAYSCQVKENEVLLYKSMEVRL